VAKRNENKHEPRREQFQSLDFKEDVETNARYYGDDEGMPERIVTNYYYKPSR